MSLEVFEKLEAKVQQAIDTITLLQMEIEELKEKNNSLSQEVQNAQHQREELERENNHLKEQQNGWPGFDIRRMNMLLAVLEKRVGFKLAQKDVFLNIAGGLRVNDPAIDLSVISAILSSNMDVAIEPEVCMAGEVGLSGEIRPVNRIEQRIGEAGKLGFRRFLLPRQNMQGLAVGRLEMELVPVRKVEEAFRVLFG